MSQTEQVFNDDPLYKGWEQKYREQAGDAEAWSAQPAPFVSDMLPQIPPNAAVADLGCGDGRHAHLLAEAGHRVTAVDCSPSALSQLLRQFAAWKLTPPVAVLANIESLPLASDQYDALLCANTLPQIPNCRQAMEEMHRVLKSGGLLITNVYTRHDVAFGEGDMVAPNEFVYKNTFFRFFDEEGMPALCQGLFQVEQVQHVEWDDPPHVPFRPYPHHHDTLAYVLRKT